MLSSLSLRVPIQEAGRRLAGIVLLPPLFVVEKSEEEAELLDFVECRWQPKSRTNHRVDWRRMEQRPAEKSRSL